MSEQLSWPRLQVLLRNHSIGEYRNWLIASAVVVGVLLIGALMSGNDERSNDPYYRVAFFAILVVWGTIQSSLAFSELHDKNKNTGYLLLPASALEKTLAPLLTTTVVLIAYLLVLTAAASAVIEGLNWLAFRRTQHALFNPFAPDVWTSIARYLVVQSWFFVGAAWFRKAHYIKTLLATLIACCAFLGLVVGSALVAGLAAFTPDGLHLQAGISEWLFVANPSVDAVFRALLAVAWSVVLPVFCWFVAWLRVSETQVSHGV